MQLSNEVINTLIKNFHDNRLGHAFLLETNNQEKTLEDLKYLIKTLNCNDTYEEKCTKCNLCHLIDNFSLPNLVIIRPDGNSIKKEQILDLKNTFSTKPVFAKFNIYIIMNAELLTSSSANTMLKFLEEPEEHIIGFFITNNKENMINTIKSRCQIYMNYYKNENDLLENKEQIISREIIFIEKYEKDKYDTIFYIKNELLNLIEDKKDLTDFFKNVLDIYYKLYEIKLKGLDLPSELKALVFILDKGETYIFSQVNYLVKLMEDLKYNVNTQLILERFVLEARVDYE